MKYFINLSTRTKLFFSFGLIWLMFLVGIIIAYNGLQQTIQSEKELHDLHFKIALDLRSLRSHQNFNRAAILDMMLIKNDAEQTAIENTINERTQTINDILLNLSKINMEQQFQGKIKELKDNIRVYQEERKKEITLVKEGKIEAALKIGTSSQKVLFEKIRTIETELGDKAEKDADEQLVSDSQNADFVILLFVIFGIVTLVFSLIIILIMNRTIASPLNEMAVIASRIASGDLSMELSKKERKDEVGSLNLAFSKMIEKLRNSIKDIIEGVNLLGSSASEIMAATTQVASGAAETATAISETTTTVEEVRQASQLSSQKASKVSDNAIQVSQVAQTGQKAVDETVNGMHHIQNQMESIANTIVSLSEQSQQIGGIIASVNDVADQSNLLAVNAAIEAAKAGEQGKGFAVVAQEIKSLALQSKQATIQVRNILSDIQKATSAAVMATEQGSKAVDNGVKQSTQTGESIRSLSQSVNESVQAATQIVASSQQQAIGMDQIGLAMNNINQASAQNAASMLQAERAAKDLNELGQNLKRIVEQYKI